MTERKLPAIGSKAPGFTLKNQDGTPISLSDFEGKKNVVLIFYPGDMTPGCTMQLCAVRDDWAKFQKKNTVVFGINSGDQSQHDRFREKHGFPFDLLVDADKKVSSAYGAIAKLLRLNIIKRTVVGIDTSGTIVYYRRGMPPHAEIFKHLL